jgi:putative sterol carrier protein
MPRYLSAEWIAEADRRVAASPAVSAAAEGVVAALQTTATDGPQGDVTYHVRVTDGSAHVMAGPAERPTVSVVASYETTQRLLSGDLSPQKAMMTRRMKVKGDLPRMVKLRPLVEAIDAELRAVPPD